MGIETQLSEWGQKACEIIKHGAEIMTLEQLSQWEGCRAILETFPAAESEPSQTVICPKCGREYEAAGSFECPYCMHEWDEMDVIAFAKELEWRESR